MKVPNSVDLFTMEIGLAYFRRHFIVEYGGTMAVCVITLLRVLVLFLVFRTRIIEGTGYTARGSPIFQPVWIPISASRIDLFHSKP